jgi:formyltetrahydrofolate hydrolase
LAPRHDSRISEQPTSRLLLACPDQPGLIAAVSGFLAEAGRNIVDADQHSSDEGRFFMRMAFDSAPEGGRATLYRRFEKWPGRCGWITISPSRASASGSR